MAELAALPEELLIIIASLIDVNDIISLSRISKPLFSLYANPDYWRNRILTHTSWDGDLYNKSLGQLINIYMKIIRSGFLFTGGMNLSGRLGIPNSPNGSFQASPSKITERNNILQVSCGTYHTGYITTEGKVFTFGYNENGRLGLDIVSPSQEIPAPIPGFDNIKQISCGDDFTAFITELGELYTFGGNNYGQLGLPGGPYFTPTRVQDLDGVNIVQISCGLSHMGAVDTQGKVYIWGSGSDGARGDGEGARKYKPVANKFVNNAIQISCGNGITGILTIEGDVYMCGGSISGELGLGNIDYDVFWPTKIEGLPPIKQVACSLRHSGFLTREGEVYMCGKGSYGLGDNNNHYIPEKIPNLPPIKEIACSATMTIMISTSGQAYISSPKTSISPVLVPGIINAKQVSCGPDYYAIIADNI